MYVCVCVYIDYVFMYIYIYIYIYIMYVSMYVGIYVNPCAVIIVNLNEWMNECLTTEEWDVALW